MNLFKQISLSLLLFSLGMQLQGQNCDPDVIVSTPVTTGTTRTIQASNSISGTSTIQTGATAVFDAGYEITLSPNFDAAAGANFDAVIGGCSSSVSIPNDPYFQWQWGHHNTGNVPIYQFGVPIPQRTPGGTVDADADILEAWETTKGSSNITVAIMDHGIDMNHPDIDNSRIRNGYNFVDNSSNYQDDYGHGTLIAGILGATPDNGIGVAGVDWNCKIMPLKVLNDPPNIDEIRNARAIRYAMQHNADIVTMSFGRVDEDERILEDAYRDAIDAGILFFASAGNDNADSIDYPARYPSIVGVGAMSPCATRKSSVPNPTTGSCDRDNRGDGTVTHWGSNYGDGLDFVAPGTLLPTTDVRGLLDGYSRFTNSYQFDANGDYIFDSYGTSMSSPFAAGVAALVWAAKPSLKNYQVRYIMQQSAVAINGNDTGHGSLNAKAAVDMALAFIDSDFLLPNLSLELVNAPPSVGINSTLTVSYRVKNTGDAPAGSSVLSYRAHSLASATTIVIPSLGVNQSYHGTIHIPTTSSCNKGDFIAGTYTLDFTLDNQHQVHEFNEFNRFSHVYEVTGLPDMVIDNVNFTNNTLSFDLGNTGESLGDLECPNFTCPFYRFYWSSDAVISNDDAFNNSNQGRFDLCPKQTISVSRTLTPQGNPNYLIVKIDSDSVIRESNEANNVVVIPLGNQINKKAFTRSSSASIQVIPNPLAQNGVVRYTLELDSEVSIVMYDVVGAKVQTILPRLKQAVSAYEIPFHKGGLSSGIYLVEVQINGERHIAKLLIE